MSHGVSKTQRKLKFTLILPLFVKVSSLIIDLSPFKPEILEKSDVLPEVFPSDDPVLPLFSLLSDITELEIGHF